MDKLIDKGKVNAVNYELFAYDYAGHNLIGDRMISLEALISHEAR